MRKNNIKIGIITFHRAINCGAVLQAFALQNTLNSFQGVSAEIIDLRRDRVDKHYTNILYTISEQIKSKKSVYRKIAECFYIIKDIPYKLHSRKEYDKFLKKYLSLSFRVVCDRDLKNIDKYYDCFIVGSDQVWNLKVIDYNSVYFLKFTDKEKRNAYAASLGTDRLDKDEVDTYKILLKDFKNISVRERNAINIVEKYNENKCIDVLDPIFLFDKEWWQRQFVYKKPEKKYIFVYMPYDGDNINILSYAECLARELKIEIIYVGDNKRFHCWKNMRYIVPSLWIIFLLNADFVITNSFHGTAFSINFRKKFWAARLQPIDRKANNRIDNILSIFELEDRILPEKFCETFDLNEEIAWKEVELKLKQYKEKSMKYLLNIINDYRE